MRNTSMLTTVLCDIENLPKIFFLENNPLSNFRDGPVILEVYSRLEQFVKLQYMKNF